MFNLAVYFQKLVYAAAIFIIGLILIKIILRFVKTALIKSKISLSLHAFLRSLLKITMIFILLIIVAGTLGVNTNSLITVLGAAGLAISLALKDSLSNLASGILLLVTHPFQVGEYIEIGDKSGTVTEIGLIYTRLNTLDNSHLYIPNSQITSAQIVNYSAEEKRRLDIIFSISYDADIETAKRAILKVLSENEYAYKEPAPVVRVCAHAERSIDIITKVWVDNKNYWSLNYDLYEQVKKAFDEQGILIPYKQIQINIKK